MAEQRLARLTSWSARVRGELIDAAPARVKMEVVARRLGLSGRSLRRQLATEGTSYREVERAALRSVLEGMLCQRGLTIQQTAYELGFRNTTSFHRAVRAWTGTTPRALRDSQRSANADSGL